MTPTSLPYPIEQLLMTAAHTDTFKVDRSPQSSHSSSLVTTNSTSSSIPITSPLSPSPSLHGVSASPNSTFSLSKPNTSASVPFPHTSTAPPGSLLLSPSPSSTSNLLSNSRKPHPLASGSSLPSARNAAGDPFHIPDSANSLEGSLSREDVEEYFGHVVRLFFSSCYEKFCSYFHSRNPTVPFHFPKRCVPPPPPPDLGNLLYSKSSIESRAFTRPKVQFCGKLSLTINFILIKGHLVLELLEHHDSVNRIAVCPDQTFFASARFFSSVYLQSSSYLMV